ncbi:MAG: hypothetical protein ACQCXQ_06740 [Verrucomicrobiales bacterium]|nr:hypothetical protein [Verrucomicrobiota bacterium JB025]
MLLASKIIARSGLVLTILPSLLYLFGSIELPMVKTLMAVGTVLWFIGAPMIQRLSQPAS